MVLLYVNNLSKWCFQEVKSMFQHKETPLFEKITVLLPIIYLLFFSILKIFNGRFLVKLQDKNLIKERRSLTQT
ncbi:hypothetical protein HMPREF9304_00035 [Hoylesella timonensis S9-PR14]|uniref:Uncharacterized protein n=1 Tax=Hoylesella timonensis S9-PR14 TaxID=1401062 RepID=A0A098YV27_9BACT|nr:hypothetical protein HMPREF9304_00035 [Hoylesella timonensis S9-PR14]